jgi:hypothetical protein
MTKNYTIKFFEYEFNDIIFMAYILSLLIKFIVKLVSRDR